MALIDISKPLSTLLNSAINNFGNIKKKFLGTLRIEPGAAGCDPTMLSILQCSHLAAKLSEEVLMDVLVRNFLWLDLQFLHRFSRFPQTERPVAGDVVGL